MTSDVATNLPSAPSTPTASVSSISDLTSTFEAVSMGSVSEQDFSPRTFTRRPRFSFDKQLIVNVRVQGVEFSIPESFLTRDSDYFIEQLKTKDVPCIDIQDSDVTSSAFESLLSLIFPPAFGVVPVVELREWIDVLYLANKWNYTSIRSAALDAIRPLASCVDTIVLAREYKLNDWLPYALRELVTRTEGLTLAEGHRLGMEVVIMVAEARNNAKGVTSSDRVDDIVDVLCHALSTGDQMAMDKSIVVDDLVTGGEDRPVLPSPPQGSCSVQDVVTEKVQRQLMAWASNTHAHEAAGQHRLLKHLQDHPSHIQAAVGAVLRSLWIKQESWWKKHIGNIRYYRNADPYSCTTTSTLALLQGHCATECFSRIIGDFCTQAINSWQPINMITCPGIFENAYVRCDYHDSLCVLHSPFDQYGLPADFVAMMTTAHAVRYLLDSALIDKTVFSKQVFSGFWDQLLQLLRVQPEALHIVQGIRVTLTLMGEAASSNQVCQEIEDFYEEVGMIAEEGNSPVLPHLKTILNERQWASD